MDLSDPTIATTAVAEGLTAAGIRAAVYGGLALAAYGEPRETKDADFAVAGTSHREVIPALERAGLVVALKFDPTRFGGHLITRIALLGGEGRTGLNVLDLVEPRSGRYATTALSRALTGELRGKSITVLAPEDFVIFKALSTRDRDLEDARSVVRGLGPSLDVELVREEAARVALEIVDHPVLERLDSVLRSRPT